MLHGHRINHSRTLLLESAEPSLPIRVAAFLYFWLAALELQIRLQRESSRKYIFYVWVLQGNVLRFNKIEKLFVHPVINLWVLDDFNLWYTSFWGQHFPNLFHNVEDLVSETDNFYEIRKYICVQESSMMKLKLTFNWIDHSTINFSITTSSSYDEAWYAFVAFCELSWLEERHGSVHSNLDT